MFTLENCAHTFCRQLMKLINSKLHAGINNDILMPKHTLWTGTVKPPSSLENQLNTPKNLIMLGII